MKHVKKLGLIAVMAMAFAAIASTASASAATFTAGSVGNALSTTILAPHIFTMQNAEVKCTEISFSGQTESLASSEQKVKPSYKNCKASGLEATVNTAGCVYTFHAAGTVDLGSCTAGGVTITVNNVFAKCVIFVPNQNGIDGQTFSGSGTLKVVTNSDNIEGEVTVSERFCPVSVNGPEIGSYTGETEVKAAGTTIGWDA